MPEIQNPTGAFGYPVTVAGRGAIPGDVDSYRVTVTVTKGNLLAITTGNVDGSLILASITATNVDDIVGISLDGAVADGVVPLAVRGPVVATKGATAMTVGDRWSVSATTAGLVASVATNALGFGKVLASATAGDTLVLVHMSGYILSAAD